MNYIGTFLALIHHSKIFWLFYFYGKESSNLFPLFFPELFHFSSFTLPKFSHLYLFLLSSQVLQPAGKAASKQRFTQRVRTWKNIWLLHAQASFLWQCYTEGYCQTECHINQKSWVRAIRTSRNYLWVGLIFFFHCGGTFLLSFRNCYISSIAKRKMFKWFKQDDSYKAEKTI